MSVPGTTLIATLKNLGTNWSYYFLFGSFIGLYVLGYLTVRFHLTALGVGVDLTVLDERYLFTGARCLVYLITTVPSILILLAFFGIMIYVPFRALPARWRGKIAEHFVPSPGQDSKSAITTNRLVVTGVLTSVLMIQLVMKQCFLLNNLLLAEGLPQEPAWLGALLLTPNEAPMALFFAALIVATAVPAGILLLTTTQEPTAVVKFLRPLLAFLVLVQCLLIPVNYGTLVVDKTLPRVSTSTTLNVFPGTEKSWLIWESEQTLTFLIKKKESIQEGRSLLTVPRKDVKNLEIVAYDRIIPALFDNSGKLKHPQSKRR